MAFLLPWGSVLLWAQCWHLASGAAESSLGMLPSIHRSDTVCLLQFLRKAKYMDTLKIDPTAKDSGFELVNRDHQCFSHTLDLGIQHSLKDCYQRVKEADAQYFTYGKYNNT